MELEGAPLTGLEVRGHPAPKAVVKAVAGGDGEVHLNSMPRALPLTTSCPGIL